MVSVVRWFNDSMFCFMVVFDVAGMGLGFHDDSWDFRFSVFKGSVP